jgi:hypothetical protein
MWSHLTIVLFKALFAYFVVLGSYGFSPFLLPGTSYYWEDPSIMILDQVNISSFLFWKSFDSAFIEFVLLCFVWIMDDGFYIDRACFIDERH